jgi:2-polyprenyl-6-methoxyphenol hydroxylase-like FAD-dependent oxidoreductase
MSDPIKTNVLIVGAGPSGMTMALALARFGISCTLIDRRETNYEQPRAHALNSRTLEMFSALSHARRRKLLGTFHRHPQRWRVRQASL